METIARNLDLKNLDKSNWLTFRFDQIAQKISETVDPKTADVETYVGLEHLDEESIHLKRNGIPSDVSGGKLKCYPGDVIFGKRRAYQRKAAIVDFEGICSAHAFVLRAIPDVIDPKLFPFFLHSDLFMHQAVDISVGGLSPTINWGQLKEQEFLLPPKEQQAELAELFWAMDEVIEKELEVLEKIENALNREIEEKLHGVSLDKKTIQEIINELSQKITVEPLNNFGEILKGKDILKSAVVESGIPCIRYGELYTKHHRIIREFYSFITEEIAQKSLELKRNDLLFAGSGETITEIGKSAAFVSNEVAYAGSDTLVFRPHDMDGIYLGYLMNSQLVRQQLNKYGTGSTVMHIYPADLIKIKIPKISKDEQIEIGKYFEKFYKNIENVTSKVLFSKTFQKSLINQVF